MALTRPVPSSITWVAGDFMSFTSKDRAYVIAPSPILAGLYPANLIVCSVGGAGIAGLAGIAGGGGTFNPGPPGVIGANGGSYAGGTSTNGVPLAPADGTPFSILSATSFRFS